MASLLWLLTLPLTAAVPTGTGMDAIGGFTSFSDRGVAQPMDTAGDQTFSGWSSLLKQDAPQPGTEAGPSQGAGQTQGGGASSNTWPSPGGGASQGAWPTQGGGASSGMGPSYGSAATQGAWPSQGGGATPGAGGNGATPIVGDIVLGRPTQPGSSITAVLNSSPNQASPSSGDFGGMRAIGENSQSSFSGASNPSPFSSGGNSPSTFGSIGSQTNQGATSGTMRPLVGDNGTPFGGMGTQRSQPNNMQSMFGNSPSSFGGMGPQNDAISTGPSPNAMRSSMDYGGAPTSGMSYGGGVKTGMDSSVHKGAHDMGGMGGTGYGTGSIMSNSGNGMDNMGMDFGNMGSSVPHKGHNTGSMSNMGPNLDNIGSPAGISGNMGASPSQTSQGGSFMRQPTGGSPFSARPNRGPVLTDDTFSRSQNTQQGGAPQMGGASQVGGASQMGGASPMGGAHAVGADFSFFGSQPGASSTNNPDSLGLYSTSRTQQQTRPQASSAQQNKNSHSSGSVNRNAFSLDSISSKSADGLSFNQGGSTKVGGGSATMQPQDARSTPNLLFSYQPQQPQDIKTHQPQQTQPLNQQPAQNQQQHYQPQTQYQPQNSHQPQNQPQNSHQPQPQTQYQPQNTHQQPSPKHHPSGPVGVSGPEQLTMSNRFTAGVDKLGGNQHKFVPEPSLDASKNGGMGPIPGLNMPIYGEIQAPVKNTDQRRPCDLRVDAVFALDDIDNLWLARESIRYYQEKLLPSRMAKFGVVLCGPYKSFYTALHEHFSALIASLEDLQHANATLEPSDHMPDTPGLRSENNPYPPRVSEDFAQTDAGCLETAYNMFSFSTGDKTERLLTIVGTKERWGSRAVVQEARYLHSLNISLLTLADGSLPRYAQECLRNMASSPDRFRSVNDNVTLHALPTMIGSAICRPQKADVTVAVQRTALGKIQQPVVTGCRLLNDTSLERTQDFGQFFGEHTDHIRCVAGLVPDPSQCACI